MKDIRNEEYAFIVVVKKTFPLRNVFFATTLMPPSFFWNILMTSGIEIDQSKRVAKGFEPRTHEP
jgi:hypothetical protein